MTFYVWCEYICSHCQELHRLKFNVLVDSKAYYQLKGRTYYEAEGIIIEDIALNKKFRPNRSKPRKGGSKIYVQWNTNTRQIIDTVIDYLTEYYAIKEGTLKVEVCGY